MKNNKGLTLLVLVVTIIILLILAGVVISLTVGNNGLFSRANKAKIEMKKAEYIEEINLLIADSQIEAIENTEKSFREILTKRIENQDWFSKYEASDDENTLIVITRDNFKISIKFEKNDAFIVYITYKENNSNEEESNRNNASQDDINEEKPEENTKIMVTYKGNGGILEDNKDNMSLEVEKNSTIILPKNLFNYEMYIFISWTDKDGNEYKPGDKYEAQGEDVEFTAKWQYMIKEELSYLRTTGNQYIDTGFVPNQDTSVEMKIQLLSRKNQLIYGSRENFLKNTYSLVYISTTKDTESFRSDYNTIQKNLEEKVETGTYMRIIKQEKNSIYINDRLILSHNYATFTAGSNNQNNNSNLFLFNVNTNGEINPSYGADLRFYGCKIWDNGKLIRDFIPVVDYNDKICIYDKINKKLYYAKYSGENEEFKKDEKSEVSELKSIIVNGKQYIDTEIKPNANTRIEMKCKIPYQEEDFALYGSRTTNVSKTFTAFFVKASKTIRCDYNTVLTNIGAISTNENVIKQDKNIFYINNVQKGQTTYGNFSGDYNLYLFAVNTAGSASLKACMEFYYARIWNGNTLVRDYVPILDELNMVHLYDKVTSKEYHTSGDMNGFLLGGVSYYN